MPMADVRLYALLDPAVSGEHLPELAQALVEGGATLVQLRDKQGETRRLLAEARVLQRVLALHGVPLVINDRVDVALATGADGVHVGQDDMPVEDARRLLGPSAIIGLSIKTVAQARAAPLDLVNYVGVGGVFATTSKHNPEPPIGGAGLRTIVEAIRTRAPAMPIAAIAGIDETNAAEVIAAGADGIAVISALARAQDPGAAARKLRGIVDRGLRARAGL
jgi:thiamine-phosphate pyrophosphorylase